MSRVVALWVLENDISAGYFVLSDLVKMLPEDTALVDSRHSYSSSHVVMRLSSKKFPEVSELTTLPRADFIYTVNDGAKIQWPSKEYEDLQLELLNNTIAESVNKDAIVWDTESPAASVIEKIQQAYAQATAMKDLNKGGCQHEWFAYGRTAAMKHCKKCGKVVENLVDNH